MFYLSIRFFCRVKSYHCVHSSGFAHHTGISVVALQISTTVACPFHWRASLFCLLLLTALWWGVLLLLLLLCKHWNAHTYVYICPNRRSHRRTQSLVPSLLSSHAYGSGTSNAIDTADNAYVLSECVCVSVTASLPSCAFVSGCLVARFRVKWDVLCNAVTCHFVAGAYECG